MHNATGLARLEAFCSAMPDRYLPLSARLGLLLLRPNHFSRIFPPQMSDVEVALAGYAQDILFLPAFCLRGG